MTTRAEIDRLLALIDRRLDEVMLPVRRAAVAAVDRAKDRDGVIPEYRLPYLQNLAANLLDEVFGTSPGAQFDEDGAPQTPMARVIAGGVEDVTRLVVEPFVAEVRNIEATNVRAALLRGRPGDAPQRLVDPARTWVDPNGYTLSHRIWQAGEVTRGAIDQLLEFHIGQGTDAVTIGKELNQYLTTAGRRETTRRPYGAKGLAAPRRLARTEMARAHGVATQEVARANPFVRAVGWRLSASHPEVDQCDENATRDAHGLGKGNYPPDAVPTFPNHPNDLCYLVQVPIKDPERVVEALGRWVRGEDLPEFDDVGRLPADANELVAWLTDINTRPKPAPQPQPQPAPKPPAKKAPPAPAPGSARGRGALPPPPRFTSQAAAERWARARYQHMTFDFDGVHLDAINESIKALDKLAQDWPEVADRLKYVGTYHRPMPPGTQRFQFGNAYAHATVDGAQIGLNPAWYGNPALMRQQLAGDVAAGWLQGGSIADVMNHEFGHMIDNWLRTSTAAYFPYVRSDGTGTVAHLWAQWKAANRPTRRLSEYAVTNPVEHISEGYAALVGKPRWRQVAYVKELGKILDILRAAPMIPAGQWEYAALANLTPAERQRVFAEVAQWWDDLRKRVRLP